MLFAKNNTYNTIMLNVYRQKGLILKYTSSYTGLTKISEFIK